MLSDTLIKYTGIIEFEPENVTKKHINQSEWKRTAFIILGGDLCSYYAWFIKKRFNLSLNKPLRPAHVSFINDHYMRDSNLPDEIKEETWHKVKEKWDGKEIDVVLNTNMFSNSKHWWLNVDHEYRDEIHAIRNELGLDRPRAGLHMTIGLVNEINKDHSDYINRLHKQGLIELNDY